MYVQTMYNVQTILENEVTRPVKYHHNQNYNCKLLTVTIKLISVSVAIKPVCSPEMCL